MAKIGNMPDTLLEQQAEKLWEKPATHLFMTRFSQLVQHYPLKDLTRSLSEWISARCYETQYRGLVPHCLMGFESAYLMGDFFCSDNRLLPMAQMLWYSIGEARSSEIDLERLISTPPEIHELTVEAFEREFSKKNINEAFRLFSFLIRYESERKKLCSIVFRHILSDETDMGHKLIYFSRTWEFCDVLHWEGVHAVWFPVLHYILKAKPQIELFPQVEIFYNKHWKMLLKAFSSEKQGFSKDLCERIKNSVYHAEKKDTLAFLLEQIEKGESFALLFEGLKMAAAELVYMGSFSRWVTSVHAFNYIYAIDAVLTQLDPQDQMKGFLMASLMVKNLSILSKPLAVPNIEPMKTEDETRNPYFFVEKGIQTGNHALALGAFEHIVKTKQVTPSFLEALAFFASKNSYSILYAHDIKFAYAILKSFTKLNRTLSLLSSSREGGNDISVAGGYLKALIRLLADQPKEYTIYQSLANTQKIKLGYFTAPDHFNF